VLQDSITVSCLLVLILLIYFQNSDIQSSAGFSGSFRLKGNTRKTFDFIISAKFVFFNFGFGGFGGPPSCSPLGCAPVLVTGSVWMQFRAWWRDSKSISALS
jgi:hypothetical protein